MASPLDAPFWTFLTPALRSYRVRFDTCDLRLSKSILYDCGDFDVDRDCKTTLYASQSTSVQRGLCEKLCYEGY